MACFAHLISLLILIATLNITLDGVSAEDRKVHIVYMGALPSGEYSPSAHHDSILQEVLENSLPSESLVHSYTKSFNGFAARITDREREKLAEMEGIVSVFPSKKLKLQTTRSWDFMGFPEKVRRILNVESDVIIGVIDSGIWPESDSFNDKGFPPPPRKWKGPCNGGKNFMCNKKVIGARFYSPGPSFPSAQDTIGHGTHTASTAAGNQVGSLLKRPSFYGLGKGNARGGVPSARIAVYKTCWANGCSSVDILAAFDDAISDGVDIISISINIRKVGRYHEDPIAIGAFHAMQKGILTSHAAGNFGPHLSSVASAAPWLITVAGSSTDRQIVDTVILGNGTKLLGTALNGFDLKGKKLPLVHGANAASSNCDRFSAGNCEINCLDRTLVKGKLVFCDTHSKGEEPFSKLAAGVIFQKTESIDVPHVYPLPASALDATAAKRVLYYIKSTVNPQASISKSEVFKDTTAPAVISFSGRGPNPITADILKPDVTAPGVNILAAWSPVASPSEVKGDTRSVNYNMISGTSMACPHVAGAAAYVKTFHLDWSPSAIKSALMTTAFPLDARKNPDAEFAYGAGQIDPVKAVKPGLVYDALEDDYLQFFCSIGYSPNQIRLITGKSISCSMNSRGYAKDLNYPSMTSNVRMANFRRTVTNIGTANSTYTATISCPPNLVVNVSPKVLSFKSLKEKKSFVVTVTAVTMGTNKLVSASLVWSDGFHEVRSPIVVYLSRP